MNMKRIALLMLIIVMCEWLRVTVIVNDFHKTIYVEQLLDYIVNCGLSDSMLWTIYVYFVLLSWPFLVLRKW